MSKHIIIAVVIIAILANFIFLSIGYGQGSIGIKAVVPQTEFNRNVNQNSTNSQQPLYKENKYLYFFEKSFALRQAPETDSQSKVQTSYDKIASYGLMVLVLVLFAAILLLFLHIIDDLWDKINHKTKKFNI